MRLNRNWIFIPAFLGIAYFVLLCFLRYSAGNPLWLDEKLVYLNLKGLKPLQIFGPLWHSQCFPRFYLFLIQALSNFYGDSVYVLRCLPFLFMLFAFWLWLLVYKREEGAGAGYLLFILSWCGSSLLLNYSAQLKQYSVDVFAAGIFSYFILHQKDTLEANRAQALLLACYLFLPSLILFSYPAYFFILLPAYNLTLSVKSNRRNFLYLGVYIAAVLVFIAISYFSDLRYGLSSGLQDYWKDYFISTVSFADFLKSFTEGLRGLFVKWFLEAKLIRHIMTIFLPLAVFALVSLGIKRLKKDNWRVVSLESLSLVVIIGLFAAGILRIYPFTGERTSLFLAGIIFFITVKAITMFRRRFYSVYLVLAIIYSGALIYTSLYNLLAIF